MPNRMEGEFAITGFADVDSASLEDKEKNLKGKILKGENLERWKELKWLSIDNNNQMKAALEVDEDNVTAETVEDMEHSIAALYQSAGIDKGFVDTFLGLPSGMKFFQLLNYAMTAFDVVDGGLDFAAVYELAQYRKTVPHAVWLAATTVITLVVELWIKAGVWTQQSASTKGAVGWLDIRTGRGRAEFIVCCAVLEVAIFFVEDATTLFIFWQTGLAGSSAATTANLYFSVASGVMAFVGFAYGLSRLTHYSNGDGGKCIFYSIAASAAIMAPILAFWCWFGLGIINEGEFYKCIGGCAAKADAVAENPALFEALVNQTGKSLSIADAELLSLAAAFFGGPPPDCNATACTAFGNVDGSGEAIDVVGGSSNISLAENATLEFGVGGHTAEDERVNKAVLAMYVLGWIFAVMWVILVACNLLLCWGVAI